MIEEEGLSWLNIAGMVVCVLGIALHTVLKAVWARRKW